MTCEKKRRLRAAVRQAGKAVGEHEREELSAEVLRRIENSLKFNEARVVAAYSALADEISTIALLRRWSGVKKLVLPSIEYGRMIFREYTGEADMRTGLYGIREPSRGRIVPPEQIDVMIVPGLAFDRQGKRLGRGRGYYDSYLRSPYAAQIHKIGVCLPYQFFDEVPFEEHDVEMNEVVTV